ncbi:MAG TPA: hypothetical protein VGG62_10550 [Terracidiphilus sp.]|jgi:hypothetical protein
MTSNVSDILTDSLIFVGAYAQGQTPNTDDMSLAFRIVNRKIDSLSAEKLSMVGLRREQHPLSGLPFYAYGPGLQWDVSPRPIKIKSASVVANNGVEKPCKIDTADQWAAVADKSRTGIYAEDLFYDNGYPTGMVYLSPMPASGQAVLWTFQAIPALASQTGTVDLAPGYTEAIVTVAAVELCIAFQRPLTEELNNAAIQAKNVIAQLNAELFNAPAPPPEGPGPTSPPASRTT